ncbi:MAG TPA: DEAD/DEAH box helicase, partial [Candidatus Ruthenibacterium avium]|nr:DEAD/DEAH box helicase [Candidatus Ruthenibacterium avium]
MRYEEMNLPEPLRRAVERMGFDEMTQVQELAIPPMCEGFDLIAKAPTGTGKTCAFGIPLLMGLDTEKTQPQAVVLAPTRELAQQIAAELRELAHFMPAVRIACLYGGGDMRRQTERLKKGVQLVVATPGRLMDHIKRGNLRTDAVTDVVLDEADEMLNMGFYKDVVKILDTLKARRRLAMFSATISREVMDIGWLYQRDAKEITVQAQAQSAPQITQYRILTTGRNKLPDVTAILSQKERRRVMIFCNTKYTSEMVAGQLAGLGYAAACLNGDMAQGERNRVMNAFREGGVKILAATDVAARGIDVAEVDAVINYDVPTSNEY